MTGSRKTTAKTITLDINLIKKVDHLAIVENRKFSNIVETLLLMTEKIQKKQKHP